MTKTMTIYTVRVYDNNVVIDAYQGDDFKKMVKLARKQYPFNKITATAKLVRVTLDDIKLFDYAWEEGEVSVISEEELS